MSKDKESIWMEDYPRQLTFLYEDTKFMLSLFREKRLLEGCKTVLDLGCGGGSRTIQVAREFPEYKHIGIDYVASMIELAKRLKNSVNEKHVEFEWGDWMKLGEGGKNKKRFDLIYSFHTLSCFRDVKPALEALMDVEPKVLVIKSLFYDGPMDVLIHQRHYTHKIADNDPDGDFNIFSMDNVEKILKEGGFRSVEFVPFEIPIELPRPAHKGEGSYTRRLDDNPRAQFSGPVYLPWYFLVAKR